MVKPLDRQKFLDNLQYRMGWKAFNATDLENEIGVYGGYISRMRCDPQKLPALDIAWKLAQALEVNLEWLIEGNIQPEDDDTSYLYQFLRRLFDMTAHHELNWSSHRYSDIQSAILGEHTSPELPFLVRARENGPSPVRIRSLAQPDFDVTLKNNVYSASLDGSQQVFILSLSGELSDDQLEAPVSCEWIELLMWDAEEAEAEPLSLICSSVTPGGDYLKPELEKLYLEIQERSADLMLAPAVKKAIDRFMQKTNKKG